MNQQQIIDFVTNEYNMQIAHPFERYPEMIALEHNNGKWFGLISSVEKSKLGLHGIGEQEILNLKIEPELNSILQQSKGFLPGYHMNKQHWISVVLAEFSDPSKIADLIEASYQLTSKHATKKATPYDKM